MGPTRKPSDPTSGLQMRGFELITKVMEHITIMDWLKISRSLHSMQGFHHQKGQLIDLDINEKILSAVQVLNDSNLNTIALATNERSQLQGVISTQDVLRFLVENYKGNIDFFQHYFHKFEDATNTAGHTSRN